MEGQIVFWSGGSYETREFIDTLLPLSVFVNSDGVITDCSRSFRKSIPGLRGRSVFTDFFDVQRPSGHQALFDLDDPSYFVVISDKRNGNCFKCTKLKGSKGIFLLVCSPMLNELNSPTDYGLEVSDFAPHDIVAEYLFVLKVNQMGMREANQLIDDMTRQNKELEMARKDLVLLNQRLEEKAERSNESLRVAESGLVEGEKLALLGRLAAGVAHEMNTPLGAITASADNVSEILKHLFKEGLRNADHDSIMTACKLADDFTSHDTLTSREERQEKIRLVEHLSTVYGIEKAKDHATQLVESGIIADDKDVLDHIYHSTNIEAALNITTTIMKVRKSISTIEVAAQKAANVVRALKSYVRNDDVHHATVFDVSRSIRDVLLLFASQIKKGVEVHLDIKDTLLIQANESEVSKVWSNLIANALYAMNYQGYLNIQGLMDEHNVIVKVTNDGPEIPQHVLSRLFEPFYSTKPVGEGSGMGLSIVFNVVASMNGSIEVETGENTTFIVTLPKMNH